MCISVSETAWKGLATLEEQFGVKTRLKLWMRLPEDANRYVDARPDELTQWDVPRLEDGLFPLWHNGDNERRIQRTTRMERHTVAKLAHVATSLHMTNPMYTRVLGSDLSRVAILVEALGLGYVRILPPV